MIVTLRRFGRLTAPLVVLLTMGLMNAASQFQKDKLFVVTQFPPELTDPEFIPATHPDGGYVDDTETVMGIALEGESRAYPLRIMAYHHVVNDVIRGRPIVLAY